MGDHRRNHGFGSDQAALREVLLDHLAALVPHRIPGTDGLTERDVLRQYLALASAGVVPGRVGLIRRHPHLIRAIEDFFTDPGQPSRLDSAPIRQHMVPVRFEENGCGARPAGNGQTKNGR